MLSLLKRRLIGAFCILGVFAAAAFYACNDHGLDPEYFAIVRGELNVTGKPPAGTDELLLALVSGLSGGLSLTATKSISGREFDLQADTQTIPFEIETEADSLEAFFVIWKEAGVPLSLVNNIVGSHCEEGALLPIELANNDTIVSDVAIDVNLKKVNRVAGVSGVIEFQGAWPSDIENLAIVFADSILITSIIQSFLSEGSIVIDVCTLLQHADIRFIEDRNVDSLRVNFKVAPGPTLMIVAMTTRGQSILEPTILTSINLNNLIASTFDAARDSTISGLRSVAEFVNN